MGIPTKQEMISKLRSLLILAGKVIMMIALASLSVDAAEIVPGPEREKDIEETCEENEPSAKTRGNDPAGSITARNEKTSRPDTLLDQMTAGQVSAEKAGTGEGFLRVEASRTMVPNPVLINNYRRALVEYLILVNTLLPEPYVVQWVRPHRTSFLAHTISVAGSLSSARFSPSLVQDEETPFHSKLRTQRVVNREPARSVLSIDFRARNRDRARTEIMFRLFSRAVVA